MIEGLHFVDEGEGPPLLLLHGNPTSSFLYREIVAGLRDRFRCIAPDLPGFGRSAAPPGYGFTPVEHAAVIEQLVVDLDLRDVTMMVQDWGGPIGFAVAGRHPDRFARFVIGNTWAWPMTGNRGAWVFSKFLGGPIGKRLILDRNLFVERILPRGMKRRKLSEEVMAEYRRPFATRESRIPTWVFPREITGSAAFLRDVEQRLELVTDRPALIVWPDSDPAFGDAELSRWEGLFPNHRLVELDDCSHYIQEEAPEEIVAAIRSWAPRTG